jgi:hypothetical protein
MSNKQIRNIVRALHIIEGVFIGVFVYSPLRTDPTFLAIIQYIIVPALVISGIFMWQQATILKWFRRSASS